MGKRKRHRKEEITSPPLQKTKTNGLLQPDGLIDQQVSRECNSTIQIITGSYDGVLHGTTATLSYTIGDDHSCKPKVVFADSFLIKAHESAVRCLAVSPQSLAKNSLPFQKLVLASGSKDRTINLYHVSAVASFKSSTEVLPPSMSADQTAEDRNNQELGYLLHHSKGITALFFPNPSKLLSGSEDNAIAIHCTRDWIPLSTITASLPKAVGRPSGDATAVNGIPSGINDFAVHPNMKAVISVGKGEKCMRLWDLVKGKKGAVLNFERSLLQKIGEGKWGGEGRKVEWNSHGDQFVVAFDMGAVVFGMDSKPKFHISPSPKTKIHQVRYIRSEPTDLDILAVSTEDGRILFHETSSVVDDEIVEPHSEAAGPIRLPVAQLGGTPAGVKGRIKDFEVLRLLHRNSNISSMIVVTANSDGSIRLWDLADFGIDKTAPPEVAHLGTYETHSRITCLKAFVMLYPYDSPETVGSRDWTDEFNGLDDEEEEKTERKGDSESE